MNHPPKRRRLTRWPFAAALLLSALGGPGHAADARVDKVLVRSEQAMDRHQLAKALKLAYRAVELAPEDPRAYDLRGRVAIRLVGMVSGPLADAIHQQASADFAKVIELAPNSPQAGFARTMLAANEVPLVTHVQVSCSPEANQALDAAEDAFRHGAHEASIAAYQHAIELCPEDPTRWIYSGDAAYLTGDVRQAKMRYRRAIELDPCSSQAFRFLADLQSEEDDWDGAWQALTQAVACDPTYEVAWSDLQAVQRHTGGSFVRTRIVPPTSADGAAMVQAMVSDGDIGTHDGAVWLAWALARQSPEVGLATLRTTQPDLEIDLETALGRAEIATLVALAVRSELIASDPSVDGATQFWALLGRAREAGYLREAIFVHLLDEELAAEFHSHRDAHKQRLVDYVRSSLAPAP